MARSSAAYSQVMDVKGAKMIRGEFAAEGRITQHLKDVHLMLDQGQKVGQPLPLLSVHCDVLEACVRHGEAELDELLEAGRAVPHVGTVLGLDDVAAGLRLVADGQAIGKIVIDVGRAG